ncbi:MAG TPA: hypothetical protein VFG10_00270 [Saprospiraceae bacterium]|nr:hypothetical protein [Saprospiraceae bacterium]
MFQNKKWICVFPVWLLYVALHGQVSIRTNQILASARHDLPVELNQKHLDFIGQTNQNIPLVDQISLRTETDRFLVYRQEYLARMTVNGPSEIRRQRFLNKAELQTEQNFQLRLEHEALVARYEAVSAYRFIQKRIAIQQELKLVYEDKVNVFNKLASLNAGTEVDELLKAEYDLDELNLEIDQAMEESDQIKKLIAGWMSLQVDQWKMDATAFIPPSGMQLVIDQLSMAPNLNPVILEKQSKIEELQAEYYFEKASASQMLDFFQLRYANRPDETLARKFSAGFGINLPFKGSSRVKLAELQIDKNNEEQFLQVEINQLNQEIQSARDQLKALGERYRTAEDQWKESQNKFSLEHPSLLQADGPMTLLKAREYQIKRQVKLVDLEKAISDQYVKILDLTGALSSIPLINYFSDQLENY